MAEVKEEIAMESSSRIYIHLVLHKEQPASIVEGAEHHRIICKIIQEVITWAKELVEAGYIYEVSNKRCYTTFILL